MSIAPTWSPHQSSPVGEDVARIPLYSPEFAADPHRAYAQMRQRYGSLVPVDLAPGVPATLVIGYRVALHILNDPQHFPTDPRIWQRDIPADCPILPAMEYRPNALRTTGAEHTRYREINTWAIESVGLHSVQAMVERLALPLIGTFSESGAADLATQYAFPLSFEVINTMLGSTAEIGQKMVQATMAVFDGLDGEHINHLYNTAIGELLDLKRAHPGNDITTHLINHPTGLDEEELINQVVTIYGAGLEPLQNLIINTLLLILTDERFGDSVIGGALTTRDALDEVLFTDPPIANFSFSYPRQPTLIDGAWLPAHQPVVISFTGCNNDPEIKAGDYLGNRSHLAWGSGPHTCPARSAAYLIAQEAIDQLLDTLPEVELAIPPEQLTRRPGPFHRTLMGLPVLFPPTLMR